MTPEGPRYERETIIRWDEESKKLEVWTASGPVYNKLKKLGWNLVRDDSRSAQFEAPLRCLTLRNIAKMTSRGIARKQNGGD